MKQPILIIGAGIAGPGLALFLNKAGLPAVIYEAYPQRDDIGGGLQIAPNGMRILEQLGLSEEIVRQGVESREFILENERGRLLGRITNGPAVRYGIPAVLVARSALHRLLVARAQDRGIPIHYRKRLGHLIQTATGVAAEFEDGSTAEGSLLVGADGLHSRTRELAFPEGPRPLYTGLMTIGGFAMHPSLIPSDPADTHRMRLIFGRNGFFGYGYFDSQNPSRVMWWSHLARDREPDNQECRSWSSEDLRRQLLERHRDWPEPVGTILTNSPEYLRGPVFDVPSLKSWSKGRVILIGDAAHAISPHAGQGASIALEDALVLARNLRHSEADHEAAFKAFARERRARVQRIAAEARRRGARKKELSPAAAWVRDRLLSVLAHLLGDRMHAWMYAYRVAWEA